MWDLMQLNVFAIPNILVSGLFISFGVLVFSRNRNSIVNISFAVMCGFISVWLCSYGISYLQASEIWATFWLRLGYTAVVFIPISFYCLAITFLGLHTKNQEKILIASAIGVALLFVYLLWNTSTFVGGLNSYYWGYYPKAGSIHPAFLLFYSSLSLRLLWLLYIRYRLLQLHGSIGDYNRTRYFLIAFIVTFPGIVDFLPNYGIEIFPLAFIFVVTFTSIVAYAILKHQLMDIEVVIKRTLAFAGLVASVVGVVSLVTFVLQDLLTVYVAVPRWISLVVASAIIARVVGPLQDWLINVTDRYLFQKKYDYKVLLRKFTDEVMVVMDFKRLVDMTVSTLVDTMKLDSCSLLMLNKDTRAYELVAGKGINGRVLALKADEPFITFLRETHEPIGQDGEQAKVQFPEAVTARMTQLHARLCLPLHVHEELIGVLCLGKKKSDEEFTSDDLDVLHPVSRTLGIAVNNAQLFDELAKTQQEAAQKEKLAVIGTLSAGINHEICNPLGIVKAQCEAFLLDQEDGILVGKSSQELLERTSTIMRGGAEAD